jgi:Zn-dependent peptidase ImmA (M78 family)
MAASDGRVHAILARERLRLESGYVDPFEALFKSGIEVYQRPMPVDAIEGAFVCRDSVSFVLVNSARWITRRRLTAAHELGHHEFGAHEGDEIFEVTIDANGDEEESQAYRFARYFLMDADGTERTAASISDPRQRIAAVASRFVVSPEAAAIHLHELGLINLAVKRSIQNDLRTGVITAGGLLRRYGYPRAWSAEPETVLDAQHMRRSINAYQNGWLSLESFADVVQRNEDEARELLRESGVEIQREVAAAVSVS